MPTDPVRLALVIAGLLLILPLAPTVPGFGLLVAIAILLGISTRRGVRLATILVLLAGAITMRLAIASNHGSDVLDVTSAAIFRMLGGGNPYGIGYDVSNPPGAPFPYGPIALLWYRLRWWDPGGIELIVSFVPAVILALRGRVVGLAVYATASVLVVTAGDGSNDTSLGLLILLAFMAATRWPALGAGVLALAVGFKLSALAFVPAFLAWGGLRVAAGFTAVSLMAWSPVIAPWGIGSFVRSAQLAGDLHPVSVWSLGTLIRDLTGARVEFLDQLRYVLGGVVAVATLPLRRSLDGVILAGAAVYLVTLFAGTWATFAYLAALAPVVCWRLDDWLGLETRPLGWPRLPRSLAAVLRSVRRRG